MHFNIFNLFVWVDNIQRTNERGKKVRKNEHKEKTQLSAQSSK
jgi:hypothetical protein